MSNLTWQHPRFQRFFKLGLFLHRIVVGRIYIYIYIQKYLFIWYFSVTFYEASRQSGKVLKPWCFFFFFFFNRNLIRFALLLSFPQRPALCVLLLLFLVYTLLLTNSFIIPSKGSLASYLIDFLESLFNFFKIYIFHLFFIYIFNKFLSKVF